MLSCVPVASAFRRLSDEDGKFETNLGYIPRSCLKATGRKSLSHWLPSHFLEPERGVVCVCGGVKTGALPPSPQGILMAKSLDEDLMAQASGGILRSPQFRCVPPPSYHLPSEGSQMTQSQ